MAKRCERQLGKYYRRHERDLYDPCFDGEYILSQNSHERYLFVYHYFQCSFGNSQFGFHAA